jgi:2-amino-4-hydroxy-6-hydroxymethyldihydropteridine diphosphokinase
MAACLVSFGANIGNAAATVLEATRVFRQTLSQTSDFRCSRLFKTPPVGGPSGQPPFVNAVVAFQTSLSAWQVWECVRSVEFQFGRRRNERWEARKLDLDILLFGERRIWTPHLKIPHPRMCMRRFILEPACDVAADWIDPVSQWSISELAAQLQLRPASLRLIAPHDLRPQLIAADVARLAGADWSPRSEDAAAKTDQSNSRWLQLTTVESELDFIPAIPSDASLSPNLMVWLAPTTVDAEVAWEDQHRRLAEKLRLREHRDLGAWNVRGPRYLLASDDRDWAIHELVAALDAMDCPVEAI